MFTCTESTHHGEQGGSILLYMVLALAVLAAISGIGYKVYQAGRNAERLEWEAKADEQRQAEELRIANAAAAYEAQRGKAKPIYRTITQTVDRLVDRPVYRNVCFDDDGLRCANAAIRGESAAGCGPDGPVPGPAAPAR